MQPVMVIALGLALAVGLLFLSRANEIFAVSVRNGRALVLRGRVPPGVFRDIADVVSRARVDRATIRAVAGGQHARLVVSGTDDGVAQRLRNVFGIHPVQKLRAAPALVAPRNLGQWLGVAWLAWLFVGRDRA
jgi:hypothetical protein